MKDESCIFCKIANGEIPSTTVDENEEFRVIFDLGPAAKGHVLILTKQHYRDITEVPEEVLSKLLPLAKKLGTAQMKAFSASGFNLVQNNGVSAGQTVPHFHLHVIPRYGREEIVNWTPGEVSAEELKENCGKLQRELQV